MTKIKICGLFRPEDVDYVNAAMPDYIGFVFAESRRQVSRGQAERLRSRLHENIIPVGVFVNEPIEQVAKLLDEGVIHMAQLHGREDEDYILKLKAITGKPVIRAISVKTSLDVQLAQGSSADYILLDQGKGGSGVSFDWGLINGANRPFFLAGGLNLENIRDAVEKVKPYAVDLSSGVETDGLKDKYKIMEIVRRIRNVER